MGFEPKQNVYDQQSTAFISRQPCLMVNWIETKKNEAKMVHFK